MIFAYFFSTMIKFKFKIPLFQSHSHFSEIICFKFQITMFPAKPKPDFTNGTYKVVIPENQAPQPVLDVSITNIQVYYKIIPQNGSHLRSCVKEFNVDYRSGVIFSKVSAFRWRSGLLLVQDFCK